MGATQTFLTVNGMTCGKCVARVEKALRAIPGVSDVAVEQSGRARITHDSGVGADALAEAVTRAGYPAVVAG